MKRLLIVIWVATLLVSCKQESTEVHSEKQHLKEDAVDVVKNSKADEEVVVDSLRDIKYEEQKEDTSSTTMKKSGTSNKREKKATKQEPPVIADDIITKDEEKRKPPVVERKIHWAEDQVTIFYRKKVFADPNVGCSASEEEFTIKLPVNDKKESISFGPEDFGKSEFSYNLSGGLYGETNVGNPSEGYIKLNKVDSSKWEVEINLSFLIQEQGPMDPKTKKETFEVSGIFQ